MTKVLNKNGSWDLFMISKSNINLDSVKLEGKFTSPILVMIISVYLHLLVIFFKIALYYIY